MLIRDCAGGVVFKEGQVLILKNEKGEWVLPKGKIRGENLSTDTAIERVKHEAGVDAKIVSPAGETAYEFFSITRHEPVFNKIIWFVMEAEDLDHNVNKDDGFTDGGFYPIEEAVEKVSYSQDKSLLTLSNKKYNEFKEYQKELIETKVLV